MIMHINKVLIIEDLELAMTWLESSIQSAFPESIITKAINLSEALQLVKSDVFDLALVDIGLPDGSGLDIVDYLTKINSPTHMVVTTIFDDDEHVFSALRKGAKGYVLKDRDKEELTQMFLNIKNGQYPISAVIANKLLNFFNPQKPKHNLTEREKEVLTLIAKGFKVPLVADTLGIKKSTCYGYVKDIYRKLDINSRAEASMAAGKLGLVDYSIN
jgi:DNA-binding NarL/FixJ family response regulator